MKNPSPGSCLGDAGRAGEGMVRIGLALTTTMRRTPVARIAWTMAFVPCEAQRPAEHLTDDGDHLLFVRDCRAERNSA